MSGQKTIKAPPCDVNWDHWRQDKLREKLAKAMNEGRNVSICEEGSKVDAEIERLKSQKFVEVDTKYLWQSLGRRR
jgi:hypothetical protein